MQIWRKMLRKALYELGEQAHLNPETFGKKNITSTIVCFSKDPSIRCCVGSRWLTYYLKDLSKNISKNITTKKD
jgi:hypothetical protein